MQIREFLPFSVWLSKVLLHLKVYYDLLITSDAENYSLFVLLGLSPAFDTIDHKIVLNRIEVLSGIFAVFLNYLIGSSLLEQASSPLTLPP